MPLVNIQSLLFMKSLPNYFPGYFYILSGQKVLQEINGKCKSCVCYIFASLFFKSKKEHLWKLEKHFLFHFKTLFVLGKIRFLYCRHSNFMTSSNTLAWNKKYILLNNLRSKHILLMKFAQFMSCCKRKNLTNFFTKTVTQKLVPGPFVFAKN